jgi:hypothetical protein
MQGVVVGLLLAKLLGLVAPRLLARLALRRKFADERRCRDEALPDVTDSYYPRHAQA